MPARILIIEDNPANLELMVYLLGVFGHTVLTATDGAEGLDLLARAVPDLIVCDVQLPRVDGFAVVRQIKASAAWRAIPVVAVTALAMVGDRDKVLAAGFNGYIGKPISPETFVPQVEAFLRPEQRSTGPVVTEGTVSPPTAPLARRGSILVADNTPVNRELARSVLESRGYEVVEAGGMAQALALARAHTPDLILSDVNMEDGSGFDFIQAVKADPQLRPVPFVFITSTHDNDKDRARGLALGAAGFLFRPLEPQTLLAEIEARLTGP